MNRSRSRSKIKRAARSDSWIEMRRTSREEFWGSQASGISQTWISSPSSMGNLRRLSIDSVRHVAVHHLTQDTPQDLDVGLEKHGSMVPGNLVDYQVCDHQSPPAGLVLTDASRTILRPDEDDRAVVSGRHIIGYRERDDL